MEQKNLPLFIAISLAILLISQYFLPHRPAVVPAAPHAAAAHTADGNPSSASVSAPSRPAREPDHVVPANAPRLTISAPRVEGSISLLGARLDDLRLRDYRETVAKNSPLVRVLEPQSDSQPSYIQFGWSAADGVKTPGADALWTSSGGTLSANHPVALTWDNGAGLTYHIDFSVDDNYLFSVRQWVHNAGSTPVQLWPWERIRRDYLPVTTGYSVLFEGLIGVTDHVLQQVGYGKAKTEAAKNGDVAYSYEGASGWAGFDDKYWLTALVPDQAATVKTSWNHWLDETAGTASAERFQVDYVTASPEQLAPGQDVSYASRAFVGAKEVHLLDHYETADNIPLLSYAVDWGHLFFLTKPFFFTIDWIYGVTGNFGVAILIFTLLVKGLFYPIAARSYRSMGKMRLLGPKIAAVRERYKDDPAKQQSEMMAVYKAEQVNPASGCLPMLIQIPVFFALYKVILVTIEMRQAPFFGWIHDLSATDPTNIFTLFGLIPWDPSVLSPMLHLGVWPLIMGATMYAQQKLNPPPPDPTQARMLQFMPLIFMFSMGRFPAGLVIYWSWNNALTIAQQWYIQRSQSLTKTKVKPA
jgi:YidC/Oxa1 family membrane protein insertase